MKYCILFVSLFLSSSCFAQQGGPFKLSGSVANDYKGYLYLKYNKHVDSSLVKNGNFLFEGYVDHPTEAVILVKYGVFSGNLFLESGTMNAQLDIQGSVTNLVAITGNKTTALIGLLEKFYEVHGEEPTFALQFYEKLDSVFTKNPRNPFCGELLHDIIIDPIFSYEQAYALYSRLDSTVLDSDIVAEIMASLDALKNSRIGKPFPAVELPDRNGKMIKVSDFKNTFVLIEFWSSGCVPCRQSNPQLKTIYETWHKRGFDIYGVSIDRSKAAWLQAVEKDGLPWTNTLAENEWKNPVLKTLNIQYIPSNYLIDRNGNIVAINIKPADLEKRLTELLD